MIAYTCERVCARRGSQATPLRFRGKYALHVSQAPEPSDIKWENLETSPTSRFWRQCLTYGLMCLLLIGSIIGLAIAQVCACVDAATMLRRCQCPPSEANSRT